MTENTDRINDDSEPQDVGADETPNIITYRMVGNMAPLFAAKAAARLEFKPIIKNREVEVQPKKRDDGSWPNKYKFTYATLDSVRDSCDEALARNGLDIFHLPCTGLDARELHTFLTHSSGAFIEAVLLIPDVKGWQEFGSAMTYAERYSYQALAGVASEHDDDGNAADGNQVQNSQPRTRSTPAAPPQAKTGGKPANGSSAQPSKPATKPEPAPQKPQDAPPPAAEPEPAQEAEKPTEVSQEPASALQRKTLGDLVRWQGFKVSGSKVAQDLLLKVCGKSHTEMVGADFALVIEVLEQAKRLETYDAAGLMAYIDEVGGGEQAAKALRAEADAFLGGAS